MTIGRSFNCRHPAAVLGALAALGLLLAGTPAEAKKRYTHWAEFSTYPRLDGDYLQEVRTDRRATPHLPFAKPLAGGPLKVLFIMPRAGVDTRDVVELWQRLDIAFEVVTVYSGKRMADNFALTTAVEGQHSLEKERELAAKLEGHYDVICLAANPTSLPPRCQLQLLHAVCRGTGMVGVFDRNRGLFDLRHPLEPPVPGHAIWRGCGISGLPYFGVGEDRPVAAAADAFLSTAACGKGRVAWLQYGAPNCVDGWYLGDCLGRPALPVSQGLVPTSHAYDAVLALAARALLWAAGRIPALTVTSPLAEGAALNWASWPAQFKVRLTKQRDDVPERIELDVRLVRPDGRFTWAATRSVTLTGNETDVELPLPQPPDGAVWLWLIARQPDGAVIDWATTTLRVTAPCRVNGTVVVPEVVAPDGSAQLGVDRDVLAGRLSPATTPMLFLCVAKSVPDELAPILDEYVQSGGVLVADLASDLRDERGNPVAPGRLLPLFGARPLGEARAATATVSFAGVRVRDAAPGSTAELAAGHALQQARLVLEEQWPRAVDTYRATAGQK